MRNCVLASVNKTFQDNSKDASNSPFIWSREPETTFPPSYPGRGNVYLISLQNQPTVYIRIANPSRGARQIAHLARQLEWAICLASEGGETQAGGTTFLHINALARLTETTLGVASVT